MIRLILVGLLLGLVIMFGTSSPRAASLKTGQPAPPFALPDQDGRVHRLADYAGQWLVVYFYPKDGTPGCTKEACHFRDDMAALRALGAQVLGISLDDTDSHRRFAAKFKLPFPLLADAGGEVAKRYDAYWSFLFIHFAKRHTFIIDPAGRIAAIYRDVDVDNHSTRVLADLRRLQGGAGVRQ